jgi:hypothetical protein
MELQRKSTHSCEPEADKPWEKGFLSPWLEYASSHRDVFLEAALRFISGAGSTTLELARIRAAMRARRQALSFLRGKCQRSRESIGTRAPTTAKLAAPPQSASIADGTSWDQHPVFWSVSIVYGDFPHLRPILLGQILLFIADADQQELKAIRKTVARRAKSRGFGGIIKKRGRPGPEVDDATLYAGRRVAWLRHVEGKTWPEVARSFGVKSPSESDARAGFTYPKRFIWTLQRREDYLAARIYEVVPYYWRVQEGPQRGELLPEILETKPCQQWIRHHTSLPFNTHPEECKRIVRALLKSRRGLRAAAELSERQARYQLKSKHS